MWSPGLPKILRLTPRPGGAASARRREEGAYLTRLNAGGNSLDRDLVRFPARFETVELTPPAWTFDTDGDTEGWNATHHLEPFNVGGGTLQTTTSGDDPYMEGPDVRFPGPRYPIVRIGMRVDADGRETLGQVFFLTEDDPLWGERKSATFPIIGDGEFHVYEIDMSAAPGWQALVTRLRLDPGAIPGVSIDIDTIEVVGGP